MLNCIGHYQNIFCSKIFNPGNLNFNPSNVSTQENFFPRKYVPFILLLKIYFSTFLLLLARQDIQNE